MLGDVCTRVRRDLVSQYQLVSWLRADDSNISATRSAFTAQAVFLPSIVTVMVHLSTVEYTEYRRSSVYGDLSSNYARLYSATGWRFVVVKWRYIQAINQSSITPEGSKIKKPHIKYTVEITKTVHTSKKTSKTSKQISINNKYKALHLPSHESNVHNKLVELICRTRRKFVTKWEFCGSSYSGSR